MSRSMAAALMLAATAACTDGAAKAEDAPVEKVSVIEAFWGNKWSKAHIIEKSVDPAKPEAGVQNKVHYEGSWNYFDEWLAPDKLRTLDGSPLPGPTPTLDDRAFAARNKLEGAAFFAGVWSLGGVPVMNVIKREDTGDGKTVRETSRMGGGGGKGFLRIDADGTFVWAGRPGGKSSGRWRVNTDAKINGDLVLEKAAGSIGDGYVSRKRGAMITLMQGQGGPTAYGELVRDDKGLLFAANVGPEFFHGKWTVGRNRSSNLLKSDYGVLTIRADGTFTHVDAGKTTVGAWETAAGGDHLLLRDPWGDGDVRLEQNGATFGFVGSSVKQAYAVYGWKADGK